MLDLRKWYLPTKPDAELLRGLCGGHVLSYFWTIGSDVVPCRQLLPNFCNGDRDGMSCGELLCIDRPHGCNGLV